MMNKKDDCNSSSSCCQDLDDSKVLKVDIVLVGNPNTGKSSLFNHLTGIGAIVSNFPGTTVNFLEGKTRFKSHEFSVVDLPGAYALSDSSDDESLTKNFIMKKHPGLIINIVDSTHLERNLYLTLQLLELKVPMIVALNFTDDARKKGVFVDISRLSSTLGVKVVEIDALRGLGVDMLMKESADMIDEKSAEKKGHESKSMKSQIVPKPEILHSKATMIAKSVIEKKAVKESGTHRLDRITTDPVIGVIILVVVFAIIFSALFFLGNYLSGVINHYFTAFIANPLKAWLSGFITEGFIKTTIFYAIDGINAGLQIALPYITVFYILMAILEDSGYLPRLTYLLDKTMHRFGLHGKAIVPMLLGFGCSVPAILGTRVLSSKKERLLTAILITIIPCSARTAVIIGATGKFIGWQYALLIYAIILLLILITALVLSKLLKGKTTGLIIEMPPYRVPSIRNILKNTWIRLKEFIYIAFPMIIIGSMVLGALVALDILPILAWPFGFIMTKWLMLPAIAAIPLIYGILRKELALEMLLILSGMMTLTGFMTPLQIFTFSLVVALYFPCIATFAVLKHEFGLKNGLVIIISTSVLAILISGIVARLMILFNVLH